MTARTRTKAQPSGAKANSPSSGTTPSSSPSPSLPLREYFALLSYHSALLVASFLFLPRSTKGTRLSQRSSADRPEHPFLTPLTADPLRTMAWHVVGLAVCMAWWGQHLRTWWAGSKKRDDSPESRQKRRRALADVSECPRDVLTAAFARDRCDDTLRYRCTHPRPLCIRSSPRQVGLSTMGSLTLATLDTPYCSPCTSPFFSSGR
jgi:hypothetical protein